MKFSAVLLKWARPKELKMVKAHLETIPYIDEIIVWDNTKENYINYGRYLGALEARNDIIYTQDDDCIVRNLPDLFSKWDGTRIVNLMKPSHIPLYTNHTMFGWGALFDRRWADCLKLYTDVHGEDEVFYRETDRIFSILAPVPFKTYEGAIEDFPSANDHYALYRQPNHESSKFLAIERAEALKDRTHDNRR